MSANWVSAYAYTREEHDVFVSIRGRNLTDNPMREARPVDVYDTSSPSLIDTYIQPKGES